LATGGAPGAGGVASGGVLSTGGQPPIGSGGRAGNPAGGNGGSPAGGSAGGSLWPCLDPQPVLVGGQDTGYVQCSNGVLHRPAKASCPSLVPRATYSCGAASSPGLPGEAPLPAGNCVSDADCTAHSNGACEASFGLDGGSCYCTYGCSTDEDCGQGNICLCGDPVGHCVPATCATDASCAGGAQCTAYDTSPGCGGTAFACQTPMDSCGSAADCEGGAGFCMLEGAARACAPVGCAIGRPFLVEGEARVARLENSSGWLQGEEGSNVALTPPVKELSAELRERLAVRWMKMGLLEHASVAAFTRFSLQLLSLGAPSSLLRASQEAGLDEIRHAELAFSMARAYSGKARSAGALELEAALNESSPEAILTTTILEGCIGETVAALEAQEAALHAEDARVREVLEGISQDETRHAELAWRTVQWLLARRPELCEAARRVFERELATAAPQTRAAEASEGDELLPHGFLSEGHRAELRRMALHTVVGPCASAMLRQLPATAHPVEFRAPA
jgi:hypothetical protein